MEIIKRNLDVVVLEAVYWVKERKDYDKVKIIYNSEVPDLLLERLEFCQIPYELIKVEDFKRGENDYCIELPGIEFSNEAENSDFTYLRNYPPIYSELIKKYNLMLTKRINS